MGFGLRLAAIALAMSSVGLVNSSAWAGDDGQEPLWQGIGSIFGPIIGFGFNDKPPPIDYREHGKIVVPPKTDLPPPGASASVDPEWPVNQEILRKKAQKEQGKKTIAGVGDARLRYNQPFPANEPVTVRAVDPEGNEVKCTGACGTTSSALGNLNPFNWVGMGKSAAPLGPEPDREWLTDPPKGFRAPAATAPAAPAAAAPAQGSASN
jgi:hypothetical protein